MDTQQAAKYNTKNIVKIHLKKMEEGSNFSFDAVQNRIYFFCLISPVLFMNLDDNNLHQQVHSNVEVQVLAVSKDQITECACFFIQRYRKILDFFPLKNQLENQLVYLFPSAQNLEPLNLHNSNTDIFGKMPYCGAQMYYANSISDAGGYAASRYKTQIFKICGMRSLDKR